MGLRRVLAGLLVTGLLVPAVLLTVARALEPGGGTWVRLVAFTPYALPLYLLAAVLLLVASMRSRGVRRFALRTLLAVALLGTLLHGVWASGPFLGGTPAVAAGGHPPVRVMTANLRFGRADPDRLVELVSRERVDVLVVEEVTPDLRAALRGAGLDRLLPHHAGRAAPGPAGTMVFARTRLSRVQRIPTRFGSYALDVRLPAMAGAAGAPGGRVRLLALHPMPPIGKVAGWHAEQAVVRQAARGLARPALLAGDLNATMDHEPMRELVGRGYQDAATQARSGWQPTWPSAGVVTRGGVAVPPLVAIDHVFVNHGLRAVRTQTFAVPGTDHRALLATFVR